MKKGTIIAIALSVALVGVLVVSDAPTIGAVISSPKPGG
jgi:hypothetical protein